jgi:8-oxo-dGTP pyrophosphatase MutT (NUDIX family)
MLVQANDIFGKTHQVDDSTLIFRPTAYAIFLKGNQTLVLETKSTGKFQLAGGGINYRETIKQGLRREVKEELGIKIKIEKFIHFYQSFYFRNPYAWDCYRYFYLCSSDDYTFLKNKDIRDEEAINPQWIKAVNLNENNFQYPQFGILPIIYKLAK